MVLDRDPRQEIATGSKGKPSASTPGRPSESASIPPCDSRLYFNRELSFLEFNSRVLQLAQDSRLPLLERLRFLTISTSNLDEFFEIRVSGLKQHIAFDVGLSSPDGLSPQEVFGRVSEQAHRLVEDQYRVLNDDILPALEREGIRLLKREIWDDNQAEWIKDYYHHEVLPVLTPIGLDPAHPFPRIINKSLNFIVTLKGKDAFGRRSRGAVVQAPRILPRLIRIPAGIAENRDDFVMLSSVMHANLSELFPGMKFKGGYQFRVTRNSDLWVDEEEVDDLLHALKGELLSRRFGGAARLEVAENCTEELQQSLFGHFGLEEEDLYKVNGPVNLYRLSALYDLVERPDLKFPPLIPGTVTKWVNIFDFLRKDDLLLHHPYQSFAPVVDFVTQAARDPDVLAIKLTVYRTETDSPIVDALDEAARAGKEVTAVVELRARFDEALNITLATRLQEAGAKVVYGIVGYKAHAKMILVVRREGTILRRYVHLGTGNYHPGTARTYTDFGLFTTDEDIGQDVQEVFQQLTGLCKVSGLRKLLQSPFTLHATILELIENEIEAAEAGRPARIIAKLNSLIEPQVIESLYRASQAGVEIDLIVRGMCCLRPGVPGVSDRIRVRSILGRFLEHSRVFYFLADGAEKTFLSSADWMPRNFFRRVEVCFPIEQKKLRRRVFEEALQSCLDDNLQAWELGPDGVYRREMPNGAVPFSAQDFLLDKLAERTSTSP